MTAVKQPWTVSWETHSCFVSALGIGECVQRAIKHVREENEISKVKKKKIFSLGRVLFVTAAISAEDHFATACFSLLPLLDSVSAHGCLLHSGISLSVFAAPYYNPEAFFSCLFFYTSRNCVSTLQIKQALTATVQFEQSENTNTPFFNAKTVYFLQFLTWFLEKKPGLILWNDWKETLL